MNGRVFFLIQLALWLAIFVCLMGPVHAAPTSPAQQTQSVQSLEDTLFAVRYDQEPLDARLKRLEETIFGEAQTGQSTEARISKLKSALSPGTLGPLSSEAKKAATAAKPPASNTQGDNTGSTQQVITQPITGSKLGTGSSGNQPGNAAPPDIKPTPGETDYPTVSQMEAKLFGKTFVQEDITRRLVRLEKQAFKTEQRGPLVDRVDNLRLVILGDTAPSAPNNSNIANSSTTYYPPAGTDSNTGYGNYGQPPQQVYQPPYAQGPENQFPYSSTYQPGLPYSGTPGAGPSPYYYNGEQPASYSPPSYGGAPQAGGSYSAGSGHVTPDMMAAMAEVEKQVIGNTFPSEPMTTRLDRIETKIFQTTSPELAPDERMQRVIAVASAGGAPMSPKEKAKSTFQTLLPIILTILPMLLL